ncbi:MAG: signal peptidase I [Spirulinaceae cyanobacterium RM2_2_10]|nr:signal peptidase I [Spirulinaceae cyanobacterium RM2_2_10]
MISGLKRRPRIGLSVVFALLIRTFLGDVRYIPSESMLPTLQVGDRLIVDKIGMRFREPQHGDVIVFSPPDGAIECNPNQQLPIREAYIKRTIGLPGDTIEVANGIVYRNDEPLEEGYITEPPQYELPLLVVPADSYFVMGDNRNASCDSHVWGPVPAENLIGEAVLRIWPPNRFGTSF